MIKLSLEWTLVFLNLDHKRRYKTGVERPKIEQKMQSEILFVVLVSIGKFYFYDSSIYFGYGKITLFQSQGNEEEIYFFLICPHSNTTCGFKTFLN